MYPFRLSRLWRILTVIAIGSGSGPIAPGQTPASKPVNYLELTFGLTGSATSTDGTKVIGFSDHFTGRIEVRPERSSGGVTWYPKGDAFRMAGRVDQFDRNEAHYTGEGETKAIERTLITYTGHVECEAHLANAFVRLRPADQRYDIEFTVMADMASTQEVVMQRRVQETEGAPSLGGGKRSQKEDRVPLDMGPAQMGLRYEYTYLPVKVSDLPLHQTTGSLRGSALVAVPRPERWKGQWGVSIDVSWSLGIAEEELRLEIEEPEAYARWLPTGTVDGKAGSPLTLTARLKRPDGSTPMVRAKQFLWRLSGTSREPGVAMNYPADAKDTRYDFDLEAEGSGVVRKRENQELEHSVRDALMDRVQVVPFDFGGWTTVEVTAVLEDGRRVTGRRKGSEETGLRVPKRPAGGKIADYWRDRYGVTDDAADDDAMPVGDGNKGDGFSNYEEYRGFIEEGRHIRTKPNKKDYFVKNQGSYRLERGIFHFVDITGFEVHYRLRADEMPDSRFMNANRTIEAPRTSGVNQTGVVMELVHGGQASFNVFDSKFKPQRPFNVEIIRILADLLDPASETELRETVAHELCHSAGVPHHGEGDDFVAWIQKESNENGVRTVWFEERPARARDDGGWSFLANPGPKIRIFDARGQELKPGETDFLRTTQIIYLGHYGQQHSGDVGCVMRYKVAQAFVLPARPNDRFLSPGEPIGMGLCTSAVGTAFNAPGQPIIRYADARNGDCRGYLCVRDDAPIKRRYSR